ncbi:Hypothetical predicted protein [Octopus vulgaris]|uniref:Uncharacterized protein n=1 Tax=Octopus vulgaris TaxID=6645 RepID=A0AA36FA73_OCTVU|nr:Hypothetical predicted protein [Octopus vulgaris]
MNWFLQNNVRFKEHVTVNDLQRLQLRVADRTFFAVIFSSPKPAIVHTVPIVDNLSYDPPENKNRFLSHQDLKNMGDVKKPTNHPKSDILKDLKHIKYVKKSHKKLVKDPVKHHKYSLFKYTMRLPECKRLIIILTGIAVLPCKRFKLSIVQGKISPLIFDFRWKNKLPSFNQGTKKLTFHCADTFQIILTTSPQSNKVSVDGQIKKIFTNRHPVLGGRLKIIGDIEIMSVEIK